MKRRLLIIVLALALAAIGTSGVLAYVKRADARAIAGMQAVSVLVAQRKIPSGTPAGTALRDGMLASETFPASSVPASALGSIPVVLSPLVLGATLQPGQLLLRPMLVAPAELTSGLAVPPGLLAVTLNFCLPEVVAGAIHAGSQVAVFDTIGTASSISAAPGCAGTHQQASGRILTRVVLRSVLVLSVGTAPASGQTGTSTTGALGGSSSAASGQSSTLVTVAVDQAEAERLIQLTETGLPYLALLTTTSRTTADVGNALNMRPSPPPTPLPVVTLPVVTPSPVPTPSPAPTSSPAPAPSQ
jgi:pilus assembly protein CpaB